MKTLKLFRARGSRWFPVLLAAAVCTLAVTYAAQDLGQEMAEFGQGRSAFVADTVNSAKRFYRQADFEKALLYLRRAEELDPGNDDVRELREACAAKAARKRIIVDRAPRDPARFKRYVDAMYEEARKQYRDRAYQEAGKSFEIVWLLAGDYRDTWRYLSRVSSAVQASGTVPTEPAIRETAPAKSEPSAKAATAGGGEAYRSPEESKRILQAQIKTSLTESDRFLDARQWDSARKAAEKALSLDPDSRDAKRMLLRIEKEHQNLIARERETSIRNTLRLARSHLKDERFDAAAEAFRSVLGMDPDNSDARKGLNDIDKAQAAKIARERREREETLLAERRRKIEGDLAFAASQIKAGQVEKAIETYRSILAEVPDNRAAQNGLDRAQSRLDEAREEQARAEAARKAAELQRQLDARLTQAKDFERAKNYELAARAYREALGFDPDNRSATKGLKRCEKVVAAQRRAAETAVSEPAPTPKTSLMARVAGVFARKDETEHPADDDEPAVPQTPVPKTSVDVASADKPSLTDRVTGLFQRKPPETAEVSDPDPLPLPVPVAVNEVKPSQSPPPPPPAPPPVPIVVAQAPAAPPAPPAAPPAPPAASGTDAAPRETKRVINEARDFIASRQYKRAIELLENVLTQDPKNWDAKRLLATAQDKLAAEETAQKARLERMRNDQVQRLIKEGEAAFKQGNIRLAHEKWNEALLIDPANETAKEYIKSTEAQYQAFLKEEEERRTAAEAEAKAAAIMEEKITVETKETASLREFLNSLSFITGINFAIMYGADAKVVVKFEDQRLRDILDTVLPPNGLVWTRRGDTITVLPNLETHIFHLDSDTLLSVQRLYDNGEIQRILWNSIDPPIDGIELTLDDRQAMLILTDTQKNIQKLEEFLDQLQERGPPSLITRIYAVREDFAQEVQTLVKAILATKQVGAIEQARKVILAGSDLIIKDTEENIREVEELLNDRQFLEHLEEAEIEVHSWNLTPREVMQAEPEQVAAFGQDVKEVIETMLYHKDGVEAARAKGRRLWYDPPTLQLTITDFPANIRKVDAFIQALPQLEPRLRSEILFLQYALAGDLVAQLEEVLGISRAAGAGVAGGNEASFSLRVEDERTFRDLSIRLVRVLENQFGDDNDDSCELVVRTSTAQSSDLSIPEFRSEAFEEYEIYVEEVDPSPTPGEGRVRLRVTYRPQLGGAVVLPPEELLPPPEEVAPEEVDIEFTPFEELNAILIRYQDPALFDEVMNWIKVLDIAVLQIQIDSKFVEVNETVAREYSSDWQIFDVGNESITLDDSLLNLAFAQDLDQFQNGLEAPLFGTNIQPGLKAATVIDLVTGGGTPVFYTLRMLEQEGVLNIVSGPMVTVANNQSAQFELQQSSGGGIGGFGGFGGFPGGFGGFGGFPGGGFGGIGGGIGGFPGTTGGFGGFGNQFGGVFPGGGFGGIGGFPGGGIGGFPGGGIGGFGGFGGFGGIGGIGGGGQNVELVVTPSATQKGQIQLDIEIDMFTAGQDTGRVAFNQQQLANQLTGGFGAFQQNPPFTAAPSPGSLTQNFRSLVTIAWVEDGGTIVLGGWTNERTRDLTSGVPVLRRLPFIGQLLFGRNTRMSERTNLLIFVTAKIINN